MSMAGRVRLRRPQKTSPATFLDQDVQPDLRLVSSEGEAHNAHMVALSSRGITYVQKKAEKHLAGARFADDPDELPLTPRRAQGKKFRTHCSSRSIKLLLRWVYKGDLVGIDTETTLSALRLAMKIDAVEFSYDLHDWIEDNLDRFDDRDLFRLLALTFVFVQFELGVKYLTMLLKRGADITDGPVAVDGFVDELGLWACRVLASAAQPVGYPGAKIQKNRATEGFNMAGYSDLKLQSSDGVKFETTRAFWAQCEEIREPLRDPTITTLKVDGDAETCGFLVKLINGVTISEFGAREFKKVYQMAHRYELIRVMDTMDVMTSDIFGLWTQLQLLSWSSEVPRGQLGPRLASWLWHDLEFDGVRDKSDEEVQTAGHMVVKMGLALRSLSGGNWHEFPDRATRGLTFLRVQDHQIVCFP